ncbi:MAG: heparinase II/III family protein [Marinosulfonomonas sp.]|nr:heparinase II/III family protein [Marinosulfonomonas sp.]
MNRFYARLSTRARAATGFTSQPEPRTIGSFARGRQLVAGNFQFAGYLITDSKAGLWDVEMPSAMFNEEVHGFQWLDDLAAVGDGPARGAAQDWVFEWITRFGQGHGAGWTPDLTGRRLIRWINHALFLLQGQDKDASEAYFQSLAHQTIFLSKRWKVASAGLPRFEALTGLIYAGLALSGMDEHVKPAVKALARECREQIDAEGGIPTRNPEELLEVFTLLIWAASALSEAGWIAQREHLAAIERIAPTLRALRHSDGSLARFHGGGRGIEGRLDHALASSGVRTTGGTGLQMGYARLRAGRSSVIVDASRPPQGANSYHGHASTLAFELTSGRRPLVVNCGSGVSFGEDWQRAGRATPSHSVLGIDGFSSSRLGFGDAGPQERLLHTPKAVDVKQSFDKAGASLQVGHDGYEASHGVIHIRRLDQSSDGRTLAGEDALMAITDADKCRFDRAMDAVKLQGIAYAVRFHLHPDVDAVLDMGGAAVSLALKSGEIWVFRHGGEARLSLEPSVYLEKNRLKPRATKQIVLTARALEYASRVTWTLAKAQDTPDSLRDLVRDDDEILQTTPNGETE